MQLAPLQALAPLVVVGVTGWTLGSALPEHPGRRVRRLGASLVLACLVVAGLWLAFTGTSALLEARPGLAPVALVAPMLVLLLVPLVRGRRRGSAVREPGAEDGDDEDGGGGGQRVPRPDADGPGPSGPAVPWDDFDEIRRGWDRVPAGRR